MLYAEAAFGEAEADPITLSKMFSENESVCESAGELPGMYSVDLGTLDCARGSREIKLFAIGFIRVGACCDLSVSSFTRCLSSLFSAASLAMRCSSRSIFDPR